MMKKVLALLLAMITLLLCACSGKEIEESEKTDQGPVMTLVENGASNYTIVVPMGNTELFSKGYALAGKIEALTGVRLQVMQDTFDEQPYEILLGVTSRKVSAAAVAALNTPSDYAVTVDGSRVLLYGGTAASVDSAIAYFTEHFITGAEGTSLCVPENTAHVYRSDDKYLSIDDAYVIVSDEENMESAKAVQAAMKKHVNLELKIAAVTDEAQKKEILIGNSNRKSAYETEQAIASPFAGVIKASGSRFMVVGKSNVIRKTTTEHFIQNMSKYVFAGKIMIPENYEEIVTAGTENADEILKNINFKSIKWDTKIDRDEYMVYVPDGTDSAWYYSHHPFVTVFKDTFYLFYSSGRRNEDDCGQRIMLATSKDFEHWTLEVFLDAPMTTYDNNVERVLTAAGVYVYEDTLNMYYFDFEFTKDCLRPATDYATALRPLAEDTRKNKIGHFVMSTKDGKTWTEAKNIGNLTAGNMNPVRYTRADGKDILLWAGYGSLAWTEDLTGTSGWQNVVLKLAPGEGELKTAENPNGISITESSIYQLADGTFILFSRTDRTCNSLVAASFDGGKTWTNMYISSFTDHGAKFEFGTLPDGRYYYLGNVSAARAELVVMVSEDGVNFKEGYRLGDTYYKGREGMYKGGNYGYPTSYIDGEYMYIVYSKDKEAVGVTRVALSELK